MNLAKESCSVLSSGKGGGLRDGGRGLCGYFYVS